jgi:hypothetical protein
MLICLLISNRLNLGTKMKDHSLQESPFGMTQADCHGSEQQIWKLLHIGTASSVFVAFDNLRLLNEGSLLICVH